jgi:hypothetical protein
MGGEITIIIIPKAMALLGCCNKLLSRPRPPLLVLINMLRFGAAHDELISAINHGPPTLL